jgi:uncharacterized OsmC-like protein
MPESLAVELNYREGFSFTAHFPGGVIPDLITDEGPPLGKGLGPSPTALLATAVGNCLSASLLFCLRKAHLEPEAIKTAVNASLTRNDKGRLRVTALAVHLEVDGLQQPKDRTARCIELFEDYCVVTASVRAGIPVAVTVNIDSQAVYSS